jgi:hypothetical protein
VHAASVAAARRPPVAEGQQRRYVPRGNNTLSLRTRTLNAVHERTSGNPGGRPKALAEVHEAARAHTDTAVATLARICGDETAPPAAQVAAATALLDRGWGRPMQAIAAILTLPPVQLSYDPDALSEHQREVLREILLLPPPPDAADFLAMISMGSSSPDISAAPDEAETKSLIPQTSAEHRAVRQRQSARSTSAPRLGPRGHDSVQAGQAEPRKPGPMPGCPPMLCA